MIVKYIKSDLYRYTGKISFKLFLKNYLLNRGFNFSVWLRLASAKTIWAKFAYPIYYYKKKQYGIDIHITTKIGYGLYIGHGAPMVWRCGYRQIRKASLVAGRICYVLRFIGRA